MSQSVRSLLVLIMGDSNLLPQEKAHLLSTHLEACQAWRLPWIPILTQGHCFLTGHRAKHGLGWASQGCFLTRQALQLKPCLAWRPRNFSLAHRGLWFRSSHTHRSQHLIILTWDHGPGAQLQFPFFPVC